MKKLVALLLCVLMALSTFAMAEAPAEEGKVLNIYCWNEEFKTRFEAF